MDYNQNNSGEINQIGSGGLMNPDSIIEDLNIKDGMTVADFGCGAGYFTIPIAKIVKNSGKVYAIDVLNSSLESVSSKAKLYGLLNITTIRANVEAKGSLEIEDKSTDFVILANILFQTNDYDSVLNEAKRITKDDGKIVIIDWIPNKIPMGPKFEHCLSENDIKKLAIRNGLKAIKTINAGSNHYGMVFSVIR
ncbi:MAG: methyltransferase domain-containing protein [Candidatus Pacebacteria bacterium]|nr:methyltransferase domain-containing protein [Candidatus Paceibacterota bacterium]